MVRRYVVPCENKTFLVQTGVSTIWTYKYVKTGIMVLYFVKFNKKSITIFLAYSLHVVACADLDANPRELKLNIHPQPALIKMFRS